MDTHDRERGKRKEKRAAGTSRPFKNSIKKYNNKPPLRKRSSLATTERSKSLHRGIASYNRKTVENDKDLLSKSAETECLKEIVENFCGDAEELNTSAAEIVASRNGSDANHSQIESNFPDKVTALNSNMHLGEQMKNHSFSEKHDSFSSNLWDMFEQGYYPSKVPHDFSTNPFSSKRMEIDNHLLSIQQDQAHLLSMLDKRYPPIMLETLKEEDEFSEPDSKINSENDSQNTISTGTSSSATQGGLHINFGPSDVLVCEQDEIKYESKSKSGKPYGRLRKVGVVDAPSPSITANVLYENKWALDHDVESNSLGSDNSTTVMFKDPGQSSVFGQLFGCLPIHKKNMFGKKRDTLQPQGEKKKSKLLRNYSTTSMLTPAVILHPQVQGNDQVSKNLFDENIGEDLYVQLAASHVGDAMDGRGRFGLAHAFFKTKRLKSVYSVLSSRLWRLVMYFTILTHSITLTFEQPLLPYFVGEQWDSSNTRPYLSILIIDAICILIYASDVCLHSIFLSWRNLWSAKETIHLRAELMLTLLFTVDFIILITQNSIKVRLVCPFRCLRATMLLCKSKHVSHIFNVLLSIIAKLGKVFFIIIIFIVTFSCIGLHLFLQDYQDLGYTCHNQTAQWNCSSIYEGAFNNLASATMHMFVLMSTENYPEFIIPAFSRTWANFFYFGFYLYVGVFFLTAILLAIIVESYWEYSKVHVKQERKQQREQLAQAWNLLDPLGKGEIPVDDPSLIRLFKIIMPKNTEEENRALIKYISLQSEDELKVDADDDEGNVVVAYDWTTKLIDALSFEFDKEACFVEDGKQGRLRRFVNSKTFSVVVLNLILVHSLLFCCMWDGITDETQLDIQIARSVIVTFFFIEFLLRMIAEGRRMFNMYDMVDSAMIVFANTGSITWFVLWTVNRDDPVHLGACVVVSSISVLIRTFFISLHARSSIGVLRSIYPVMFDLIILVVIIIFFYAVVGYECFQDNTLEASRSSGYVGSYTEYECEAGFKSFGCSLLSVFQIVTSNDWHELMLGAQLDAGWQSAFYFITCYLIINMIVMNLFVAISIEAYKKLAKYDRNSPPESTEQDETTFTTDTSVLAEETMRREKAKRLSAVSAARSHIGQFFAVSSQRDSNTWSEMRPASHLLSPSLDPTMTSPELKRVIMRRKSVVTSVNRYVQMSDLQKPPNVEENDDDDDDDDTQLSALSDINLTLQEKFTKREQLLKEKQKARRERRKELKSISESSFSSSASCASLKSRENMEKCSDPVVKKLATIIERSSPRNSRHQQRTSQIRLIRRADGNWPRNIHGEMTIMNHDELKQLSPLFRGGLEVGKRHSTNTRPTNKPFSVSSGVMDVMRRTSIHLPLVTVSESAEVNGNEVAGTSKASSNERRRSRGTLLDISKLQLQLKTRDCKKSTKKRYPSWMQRFVDEKNLSVDGDVKLKSHRNNK